MSSFKDIKSNMASKHITDLKNARINPHRHHKGKIDYKWIASISKSTPIQLNYNLFLLIFKSIGFNNKFFN